MSASSTQKQTTLRQIPQAYLDHGIDPHNPLMITGMILTSATGGEFYGGTSFYARRADRQYFPTKVPDDGRTTFWAMRYTGVVSRTKTRVGVGDVVRFGEFTYPPPGGYEVWISQLAWKKGT